MPFVAISEPEYRNNIFHAMIISARAGIALMGVGYDKFPVPKYYIVKYLLALNDFSL